ncbi:MAG: ABC transporter permease, partial [Bacteroidales bacterium]|nr:ABC transporter permease [Bacteroidales bacterium]
MFGAFVIKEFRHILRDWRTLMMILGMPILMILLFGFAISTEIKNVNVGVIIAEDDVFITDLVTKIDQSEYFTVKERYVSEQAADRAIKRNEVDAVLSFGPEFGRKVQIGDMAAISIITDASNPNNASTESMYLSGIISDYLMEKLASSASSVSINGQMVGSIVPNTRMLYNPQLKSAYN